MAPRTASLQSALALLNLFRTDVWKGEFDAFSVKVVPPTFTGVLTTCMVWCGLIAYIVVLAADMLHVPAVERIDAGWAVGQAFGMNVTCVAVNGCLLSNVLASKFTVRVAESVPLAEQACVRLGLWETYEAHVVHSVNQLEGLSVMWRYNDTAPDHLAGAGVVVHSQLRCDDGAPAGCVDVQDVPVKPGTVVMQRVKVINATAVGAAARRVEWYALIVDNSGAVVTRNTRCPMDLPVGRFVQTRFQLNPQHITVHVSTVRNWLSIFGNAGGAYGAGMTTGLFVITVARWGRSGVAYLRGSAGPSGAT